MKDLSQRYAYHLDDLRRQKGFNVKSFCENICTDRSYRRYISGERQLPQVRMYEFCSKLGISPNDFYYSFLEKDRLEFLKVINLYDLVIQKNYLEVGIELEKFNSGNVLSSLSKKIVDYVIVRMQYETNKITRYSAIDKYSKIVNFPDCKDSNLFDFADIITLTKLSDLLTKNTQPKKLCLDLLERILRNKDIRYVSSDTRHIMPDVYGSLAIMLGREGEMEKCKQISLEGIKYSIKLGNNNALTQLYYAYSLSNYKLGFKQIAYEYAVKCLSNTIARGDDNRFKLYYNLLFEDYGIEPLSLFQMVKEKLT